jgi:hypothetical protein
MEQKVRLPYDDVHRAFEEGGYLPIFCITLPDQRLPEMIHTSSEEFGPDSIASQEAEQHYDDADDLYYDDPDYRPPFDPNGVVYTFYLPKQAELCTIKVRETKDGGTLIAFKVSETYDPAFSPYLDCVAARYHTFLADMRLLMRGLALGKTVDSFLVYKHEQATAAPGREGSQQPAPPLAGDAAPQLAEGAQQQSPAPTSDEMEQREQAPVPKNQNSTEQAPVRKRRRPDVEERDNLILAIYQEHPDWQYYKICIEAQERAPHHTFSEETVRNAFRRHGIQRRAPPKRAR